MPILAQEPNLYPDSLLETPTPADGVKPLADPWWAAYTKPRQEKAVARELWDRKIAFYLPLVRRTAVYNRHHITAFTPLFPGYVFVCGWEDARAFTLGTGRILRILPVDEPEQLRRDLRQIEHLIASGAPLTVESRLLPGSRVRVKRGPLAGLEGTVMVRRGQTRLLVHVNFLQQGASVEIDDYLLEPAT